MAIKLDLTLVQQSVPEDLRGPVEDMRAQVIDVVQGVRQMSQLCVHRFSTTSAWSRPSSRSPRSIVRRRSWRSG